MHFHSHHCKLKVLKSKLNENMSDKSDNSLNSFSVALCADNFESCTPKDVLCHQVYLVVLENTFKGCECIFTIWYDLPLKSAWSIIYKNL